MLIHRFAILIWLSCIPKTSLTYIPCIRDTFLRIALPGKHHKSLLLLSINTQFLLATYRRASTRCASSHVRSSSICQHSQNQLNDNYNLIMRPAVSLLYTTTVLSALGHALSLWSHPKPLSLQERASIWGLPDCASTCVTSSFGGCNSIDVECICRNKEFLDNLGCCMSKACSKKDQDGMHMEDRIVAGLALTSAAAIGFANNFCQAYKVSDLPTAATCKSTDAAKTTDAKTTPAPTLDPSSPTSLLPALSSAASAAIANVSNGTNSTAYISTQSVTVTATVMASSKGQAPRIAAEVTGWAWGMGAILAGAAAVVV
jgi:hypothetical protein